MAQFPNAPTWASPITIDEVTKQMSFNPIWLAWFVGLVKLINDSGGGVGVFEHDTLPGLKGGTYHLPARTAALLTRDRAFTVTLGEAMYSVTIPFTPPFPKAPVCVANSDTDFLPLRVFSTEAGVTISAASPLAAGSKIHVVCKAWE